MASSDVATALDETPACTSILTMSAFVYGLHA